MTSMRLRSAMIFVKDIQRMAAFYGETLGLRPMAATRTDSLVEFDAGGAHLALHALPVGVADQINLSAPAQARTENPLKLIFVVGDVERERLRRLGGELRCSNVPGVLAMGWVPRAIFFRFAGPDQAGLPYRATFFSYAAGRALRGGLLLPSRNCRTSILSSAMVRLRVLRCMSSSRAARH